MSQASKLAKILNNAEIKSTEITLLKSLLSDSTLLLSNFEFDCGMLEKSWAYNLKSEVLIVFSEDHSVIAFGFDWSFHNFESISKWYTVRGNLGKYIAEHVIAKDLPTKRNVSKEQLSPCMRFKNHSKGRNTLNV